jgi:superfamily II DNA or RNA helicase
LKQSYIQRYIDFHATAEVKNRGKKMYDNSAIINSAVDTDSDEAEFVIKGTINYRIRILGFMAENLFTSCTCPFDWGSTCKHTIAALHFIDNKDFINKKTKKATKLISDNNKRSRANQPYLITGYKYLTHEFIYENLSKSKHYKLRYNSYDIEVISITPEKITYKVGERYDYRYITVEIFKTNGAVYSKTSSNKAETKLTTEEASILNYISESKSPDYLHLHFSGKKDKQKTEYLSKFGFDKNTKFEDYFSMSLDIRNGLQIEPNKNAQGLLPINNEANNKYFQIIDEISSETSVPDIDTTKKEKRVLGFVLAFGYTHSYSSHDEEFQLVAIKGKTDKGNTKIASHIDKYDNINYNEYVNISTNQKELLAISNNMEDNGTSKLSKWKQIFKLLINEKYVFIANNGEFAIKKKDLKSVEVSCSNVNIELNITDLDELIELAPNILVDSKKYKYSSINRIQSDYYISNIRNTIFVNDTIDVCEFIQNMHVNLKMHSNHKDLFYQKVIKPLSQKWSINTDESKHFKIKRVTLKPQKKQIYLSEQGDFLLIKLVIVYDNDIKCVLTTSSNNIEESNGIITEFVRLPNFEDEFINFVAELHPDFNSQMENRIFHLSSDQLIENHWFFDFFDKLQNENIEIFGLKDLKNFKYSPYKANVTTSLSSGQDWFDVDVKVSFGDTSVSLAEIKKAVIKSDSYIQLKDGSVGILPEEWLNKLNKYFRNGELKKDKLLISKLRFSMIDELFEDIDSEEIITELNEKRKRLKKVTEIKKVTVPRSIKAKLRPYQKEGLNWLHFLDEMKWGGILADDMGLGKTLQILTFLSKLTSKKPSLIIVPTTLLFNWENEIAKFSPHLKAFYYYGGSREKETKVFSDYDIIFSTYGIVVKDIEILKSYKFNYLILDESQSIKNPSSLRYKATALLKAHNKIALTGTPIENSTFDLFAQMTFVNPGFLGTMKSFKDNYSNAIDKEGNQEIAVELQKIINPFILRRTKEQVASELPSKTEDIIYCEMAAEQRKIYDAYKNEYRNKLLDKIDEEGLAKSKMYVLEGLLKLRQICDSPALLKDNDINSHESVKINELVRYISDKTANHKILIFSQFTSMLALIKEELHSNNIDYEYLDGKCSVKQREKSVNNFQENEKLRVFLISLKAGGMGLNLTAADYVFIVDPWWNPAVEEQAIDRCYRIGQDKNVFAYRMICKDTIEEKIIQLQAKKKKISSDLIKVDDESIMKGLKINDIKSLFS